jgi:hypothetical protein
MSVSTTQCGERPIRRSIWPMLEAPASGQVRRLDNLVGVPSYHFDPLFAQAVDAAFDAKRPSVVALECPRSFLSEFAWAAEGWPAPVASVARGVILPLIPGDSIFHAFRRARSEGVPVVGVDLDVGPTEGDRDGSALDRRFPLGPELARDRGQLFQSISDRIDAASGPPSPATLAREAHMAEALSALMTEHQTVLWVGGMAHWTRVCDRINGHDFGAAPVATKTRRTFHRARLDGSALHQMTGRTPWMVAAFAADQRGFKEDEALRRLGLEAFDAVERGSIEMLVVPIGARPDAEDEPAAPVDVGRTLLYARNLALTTGLRTRPSFGELLLASSATIGNRYAGAVYVTAMRNQPAEMLEEFPLLTWEVQDARAGYRLNGRWLAAVPWYPPLTGTAFRLLSMPDVVRRATKTEHVELSGDQGDADNRLIWRAHPDDERDYEGFVEYVLRRASMTNPADTVVHPFLTGIADGVDVRETLRRWNQGEIFVREHPQSRMRFTNGAIDWTQPSEDSDLLQGRHEDTGWIDPDLRHVGSCALDDGDSWQELQKTPYVVERHRREWSLITLDLPTAIPDAPSFYDKVILPLVLLKQRPAENNLYGWLEIMFEFCAGKRFAYFSRYRPGPRVLDLARRHDVTVVHIPLHRIPAPLLRKYGSFDFLNLTRAQWRELRTRLDIGKGGWEAQTSA